MTEELSVVLTHDMQLKVFRHVLREAIEASNHELSRPDCHPEDAKDCRNIATAAEKLLYYYFYEGEPPQ